MNKNTSIFIAIIFIIMAAGTFVAAKVFLASSFGSAPTSEVVDEGISSASTDVLMSTSTLTAEEIEAQERAAEALAGTTTFDTMSSKEQEALIRAAEALQAN